jgi:ligand-binding sensor domain-containing protein/signal transduction histidine kinase
MRKRSTNFIVPTALLLLCWSAPAFALDSQRDLHEFSHTVWLTESGLPQNTVHAVAQTSDGYIWIATEEGLARFDGISFTVFDKQNTPQLKSNDIRALLADRKGALWVGTTDGLLRMQDGQFASVAAQGKLPDSDIALLYEDASGHLWIATATGLSRLSSGGEIATFNTETGLASNNVQSLVEDETGTLLVGTPSGLSEFKDGRFVPYPPQAGLNESNVAAVRRDGEGRLWLGTPNGLVCLHEGQIKTYTTREGLPNNRVISLYVDKEDSLWVGTASGLSRFRDERFSTLGNADELARNIILSVFEDAEGSLWVGTESGGLHQLKDKKITTYTVRDGLANDLVKAIYEDHKGNIWIGTYGGGLSRLRDGRFTTYTTKDGLASDIVLALFADAADDLWVGTPDGLSRLRNGRFTTYTSADGLPNDFVRSIYADREGNLWVGTRGGLARMRDGSFRIYTTADGLPNDFVGTFYEDDAGNIWIGTLGGLSRFKDEKFTTYTTKDGLSSNVVIALYEDDKGNLWIGTNGGGLDRLREGKFTTYATKDGLPDDVVYRIMEDGQSNLWLSCNRGIYHVGKQQLDDFADKKIGSITPVVYGTAEGMITRECSGGGHPAGWQSRDGKLWFSTIKGVAMVEPARLKINEQPPPVVVERLRIDDEAVALSPQLELPPGKSRYEFYYTALSFVAPEKVRFKYKLEGFDKDWIDNGTRRAAFYTNIPPGRYRFRVIAANNDGVWNETGASFGLYLKPHFYQTYWFYALVSLGISLLAWQLYRLRVRRMRTQFSAVLAERNRIARELHDNLAQEILGISVQLELVARLMNVSTETARAHLDRARLLVRSSIAEARRYVWDLRSQALNTNDLPAALADAARRLSAETAVQAQVQVSGTFRPLPQMIENNLLRIGQEAINNAVRHAAAQRILVNLKFDARRVQLSVRDNGRGFDPQAANGAGHFGLTGMRERAEQMGGQLTIHSSPGEGTEVVVDVPLSV